MEEVEEEKSRFVKEPDTEAVAAEEFFGAEREKSFLYKKGWTGKVFNNKALLSFYRWLDELSGNRSFFFLSKGDVALKPYLRLASYLKDKGVIDSVSFKDLRYNDAPAFYKCLVHSASNKALTDGRDDLEIRGFGTGLSANEVLSRAFGEFLERYVLTLYKNKNLTFASLKEMKKKGFQVMELDAVAGFSEKQKEKYPSRLWTEDSLFGWRKAERVATKNKVYVPAQLIYWNYKLVEREPFLREPNTNGAGGMFTKEEAILSGLYELVQRDAFLAFWFSKTAPPKIDPETVPDQEFQSIFSATRRYGFDMHLLNTTVETGIPSCVAVLEDLSGKAPRLVFGGGCQLSPAKAILRAAEEVWALYYQNREAPSAYFELTDDFAPFETSVGHIERIRLAANPKMKDNYDFLIKGAPKKFSEYSFDLPKSFSSKKEELVWAVRKVESLGRGYEVYAYVSEHALLKELGYEVARVIVPALLPLYLQEHRAPLGAKRIPEILVKMGKAGQSINSWPHPFP